VEKKAESLRRFILGRQELKGKAVLFNFCFSLMDVVNVSFESVLPSFLFGGDTSAI